MIVTQDDIDNLHDRNDELIDEWMKWRGEMGNELSYIEWVIIRVKKLEAWMKAVKSFQRAMPYSIPELYKLEPDYIPEDEDESDD